ncbi:MULTISPECIES: phosphoglycerate dehydrogenase [Brachybacterium]|uniref:Phosphoglycerate dehydrogenase n=2 Tax=Brachybacterium TaxID=43668 RepID=A0A3R8QRK8_9MICO|nr:MULTISPECIES: phosphoglycerate dehydrogenase [Brachybacterium]RRR20484.1 phosphoglycerate dehydrogenase [Brachybacterium paraconglomeratum]GLI32384.1 phosphoglycerate dehydrogenase [Brachybacterium conglomeratum]GLK03917.1 phosphoglycerate dehydrogenase [Brachybacterium conglomeratum]
MKILLPDTMPLDPTLPEGWEAVVVDARAEIPAAHHDAAALVVWGSSRRHLASAAVDLPQLRLVQSLAAGVEGILAAGFADDVVVATGAGLHSRTVSEHALAVLLALVRRLPEAREAQERHEWSDELGGLQPLHPEGRLTTLLGARVLIWGFGSIGQTLAPMLQGLGAQVRGAARSAGTRAGVEVIAEADVPAALPGTDVLVNILPATERTAGIVGREVLAALPDHAILVNVGRGATVDQVALREALEAGTLGAAGLDVTEPEPLPSGDPLWDAPRLLITPHGAGGRPVGADERIAANLRALVEGGEVLHPAAR